MPHTPPRVAILGAGPIGLRAALCAAARTWPFTICERADPVRIGWQQVDDVFGLLNAQR